MDIVNIENYNENTYGYDFTLYTKCLSTFWKYTASYIVNNTFSVIKNKNKLYLKWIVFDYVKNWWIIFEEHKI